MKLPFAPVARSYCLAIWRVKHKVADESTADLAGKRSLFLRWFSVTYDLNAIKVKIYLARSWALCILVPSPRQLTPNQPKPTNTMSQATTKESPAERYAYCYPHAALALESYLSYVNDYLTIERYAEDHGITNRLAKALIDEGRKVHQMNEQ